MKIYFDNSIIDYYNNGWTPFLYPILGNVQKDKYGIWIHDEEQVKKWILYGKKYLSYEKDVKKCDYIVFPIEFTLSYLHLLKEQCKIGRQYNKKVIVFYFSDNEQPIPNDFDNLIVFRTSLSNKNPKNEFAMPGFTDDLGMKYGIDKKVENLSVGFCGYVGYYNIKTFFKYLFIKLKFLLFDNKKIYHFILDNKHINYIGKILESLHIVLDSETFVESLIYTLTAKGKGIIYRKKVLNKLKSIGIKTKIVERKKMLDPRVSKNLRDVYVMNIKDSLFPLVIRGDGNYSYRLSEVLSLGRIPLFIDTNCRLPFEDLINYKELFCWCDYENLGNVENIISDYLNNKDLLQLQRKMREIYENYFSFAGFHKEIVKLLKK